MINSIFMLINRSIKMINDKWTVILFITINIYYCFGQYEGSVCKIEATGISGTCIQIQSCPSAMHGIHVGEYPQICSFIGRIPIVCCLKQDLASKQTDSLNTTTRSTSKPTSSPTTTARASTTPSTMTTIPKLTTTTTTQKPSTATTAQTSSTASTAEKTSTATTTEKPSSTTEKPTGETQSLEILPTGGISKQRCAEYSRLPNSTSCYIQAAGLFFKAITNEMEFPHQALLGYERTDGTKVWSCSGALISERFIVTSAGCTNLPDLGVVRNVRLGDLTLSAPVGNRLQELTVEQVFIHPEYLAPATYNDIALIKITKPAILNPWVRPACLQTQHYGEIQEPTRRYIVTSWNGTAVSKLRLENADMRCSDVYESEAALAPILQLGIIPDLVICAAPQINNTCQDATYDKGGAPMHIRHTGELCAYELVGVTSHGVLCATTTIPGLYTRISYYIDWIESIVWYRP